MKEKIRDLNSQGTEQKLENEETRLYGEVQAATEEVDRILAEIDKVFASTEDRDQAEKIVLEKWAPLMDAASKKVSELTKQWLAAMKKI
jgi:hypothetical protein